MCRQAGQERAKTIEFWFRHKYGLTENDPRFLAMTTEEMLTDYWAHTYFDDPEKADREVVDDDFDLDDVLAEINAEAENDSDPDDWEDITSGN